MKKSLRLAAFLWIVTAALCSASAWPEAPVNGWTGGAEIGTGVLDKDFYAAAGAYVSLRSDSLRLGAQLPIRLMLTGEDAVSIRRYDWDEVSDYTRILRYLDWRPNDSFRVRLGEPTAVTFGNGAILDHYYNATDLDHYKSSLRMAWHNPMWGMEFFANDVVRWEVMAARVQYKPAGMTSGTLRDLQIAATLAVDRAAPTSTSGQVDETHQLIAFTAPLWLYGLDIDVPLWRGGDRQLTLYSDVVGRTVSALGVGTGKTSGGWHVGLKWQIPRLGGDSDLTLRLEGMYLGAGYLPGYLNELYEVERYQAQAAQNPTAATKLQWSSLTTGSSLGLRFQADWDAPKWAKLTAIVGLIGRDGLTTQLWLSTAELSGFSLRAHWGQQHAQEAADMADMSRTALLLEARYRIGNALSFVAQGGTRWMARPSDGEYKARLEALGMARLDWRF